MIGVCNWLGVSSYVAPALCTLAIRASLVDMNEEDRELDINEEDLKCKYSDQQQPCIVSFATMYLIDPFAIKRATLSHLSVPD
jgi:hypothetical protein